MLLWGLLATVAMACILQGSQGLGFSRLSLSFLAGTMLTANRHVASIAGFAIYTLGGWLFALLYDLMFRAIGYGSWWLGGIMGLLHGIFLLVVVLPLLPHVHPRMATEYDAPTPMRRLEPPGFLGLNYGRNTPLTTLLGQLVYGIILGIGYTLQG